MPELGKAYVQIVPSAQGISGSISNVLGGEAQSAGKSAGSSLGSGLVSTLKGVIVAAGIGTMIKDALNAGGDLQQSFGGLETIYGDAADAAKKYATQAQAAGISANDYAENAVSMGAALKQAFEGDTAKAVESANTAILDMTDNAAKMGTPLESIQNAYQGFAKQNYTMLDNLKLGYGGTKEEMQRLLDDATKLSGVEYNMENLGDVYEAIHVIQGDLGLTGVAAQEASETFSGSFGAMKAAAQNLMANLALGEDIKGPLNSLRESVHAFVFNNLFPMIGNIVSAIPQLLSGVSGMIIQSLNIVSNNAGDIVNQGVEIVKSLVSAIVESAPYLLEAAVSLVTALGKALVSAAPQLVSSGAQLMTTLKGAIKPDEILSKGTEVITNILNGITRALPGLLASGVQIISNIANGILRNLPNLISTAFTLITQFALFILQNLPTILKAGADLVLELVKGIINNLPQIVNAASKGMFDYVAAIAAKLPEVLQKGIEIIGQLVAGLIRAIPDLIAAVPQIISGLAGTIMQHNWLQLGVDILDGIAKGITSSAQNIINALWGSVQKAIDWVIEHLKIGSPSKYMADHVGKWMALGIGVGFDDNMPKDEMADAVLDTTKSMQTTYDSGVNASTNGIDYEAIYAAVKEGASKANINLYYNNREVARSLRDMGVAMA